MWHPTEAWRSNTCSKNGLEDNEAWYEAEKWENCARLDLKAMYNYFVTERGYNWCLTTNGVGNKK